MVTICHLPLMVLFQQQYIVEAVEIHWIILLETNPLLLLHIHRQNVDIIGERKVNMTLFC
jgi:hypothetical protein